VRGSKICIHQDGLLQQSLRAQVVKGAEFRQAFRVELRGLRAGWMRRAETGFLRSGKGGGAEAAAEIGTGQRRQSGEIGFGSRFADRGYHLPRSRIL